MQPTRGIALGIGALLGAGGLGIGIAGVRSGGGNAVKTITPRPVSATVTPSTEIVPPGTGRGPTPEAPSSPAQEPAAGPGASGPGEGQAANSAAEQEKEKGEVDREGTLEREAGRPGEPSPGHEDGPGDAHHECTGDCVE